ncbi:carbohydrate kinase [Solibacillus sp. CAU 1738]|uniref:carbohydrate kinase family protein n=1 Tax=Solibacillus sp. CAU 1738 TaxID=3140363 RepID=UPI003260337D
MGSIVCIGEMLIDFFCKDIDSTLTDGVQFEKQAGGAPANVCATIAKLGGQAIFIGKVGADPFGDFLQQTLENANVNTSMLVRDRNTPTTLAFVSLKADGARDFVFHRGADATLRTDDIDLKLLKDATIVHFGSATALLDGAFYDTYMTFMKKMKAEGKFISFDPNFRADLWRGSKAVFIERAKQCIAIADFVKVSDEELSLFGDTSTIHSLGAQVVAVTLGKEGTLLSTNSRQQTVSSISIHAVDSTGAGDAFVGAMLYQLAQSEDRSWQRWLDITTFSNAVGAFVCRQIGAISALPTLQQVNEFLKEGN